VNAGTAVFASMVSIRIFDTLRQFFVFPFPLAFASFPPIIVPIFGHVEDLAHAHNRKLLAMFLNELAFYG
jgi:hypothetical protein